TPSSQRHAVNSLQNLAGEGETRAAPAKEEVYKRQVYFARIVFSPLVYGLLRSFHSLPPCVWFASGCALVVPLVEMYNGALMSALGPETSPTGPHLQKVAPQTGLIGRAANMRLTILAIAVIATSVTVSAHKVTSSIQHNPPWSKGDHAKTRQQWRQGHVSARWRRPWKGAAKRLYAPRSQSGGGEGQKQRPPSRRRTFVWSVPLQTQSEEEEEEQKPNPLTLLLEKSTFTCSGKSDGYYSDNSVECQVFHYCVAGAKHSWMCPEGTVFHQVHLNCVPASQDICNTAEKFFFVNDYLHKELESRGPNNTVQYAQRYYPDGYVLGDPFTVPSGQPQAQAPPPQYQEPRQQQAQPQPQPRQRYRPEAAPRGPPAQFQSQQYQPQPPSYTAQATQQPASSPAQFGGAQPSRGSGGGGFGGFPPTRVYTIPAPARPAADSTPSYIYRQGASSTSQQQQQSSVKYDDDY
ncbi:unnamed protein product, partial [Ixodes hexagonus]